jgi:nucleoside-diphosphate-sugar epimerase
MKALITGVTGFAGGYLAEHLLARGDEVLGCSSSGAWPDWASAELRQRVPLVAWDVGEPNGLAGDDLGRIAAFSPDCIYHLAAISVPDDCGNERPNTRAMAVNVEGTVRVLELAAAFRPAPRVLFTSTSHVYAPAPDGVWIDERAPLGPATAYGLTKLEAEQRLADLARELELQVVIARAFQHTGPRQSARMMLPEWAAQFARGGPDGVRVKNRDAWVDVTDVRDVVRAYRLLVERGKPAATYNVGSGVNRRSGDILDLLAGLSGRELPIVEYQPGRRQGPVADVGRLKECTGWQPDIPLQVTVADTLDYWVQLELHYVRDPGRRRSVR